MTHIMTTTAIQAIMDNDFEKLKSLTNDDFKATDEKGRNAVHAACHKGYSDMLIYIIKQYGDDAKQEIDKEDNSGNTAAFYACGERWE